jgi:serine/threonine protein kinase
MGEVYRARDPRLGRDVAIKLLPSSLAKDDDRLHRFELEARTVASLNHPNILDLFDIGEYDGSPYLVCELLEGETLRERLKAGALGQRRTVEYGMQIAQGLAAAHDKGIIHRDLKPENIFLTKDGRLKILDFGLAKLAQRETVASASADGLTAAAPTHTTPGVVLGTAGYMSPEQVRGNEVDARTDIFSYGAVLYEMLSGQRAFRGESSIETMNAILKEEPPELDPAALHVSPGLERIVRRCLEKEPQRRFHSSRDVGFALEALSQTTTTTALPVAHRTNWKLFGAMAALLVAAVAIGLLSVRLASNHGPAHVQYFAIPVNNEVSHMAISGDGTMLGFVSVNDVTGQRMLFVQRIGSRTSTVLPGTENALFPFWSPDDKYVGYFANRKLMKISISGGGPQQLASVSTPRGGSWSSKGVIIFSPQSGGPLWRINADGTGLVQLTDKMFAKDEASHRWPQFLPDGNHFIFYGGNFAKIGNRNGIWISSLDGEPKRFLQATYSNAAYVDPGKLLYVGEKGQVLMQDFDPKSGTIRGEARIVAEGVAYDASLYWGAFTVSRNGTLISNTSAAASQSQLTWVDRAGKELGTLGPAGLIFNPAISPDGTRVAEDIDDVTTANVDVWIRDLKSGTATRFTFAPDEEADPVWSPDGTAIAFRRTSSLSLKASNGLEQDHVWVARTLASEDRLPNSWTPDGKTLIYTSPEPRANGDERLMRVSRGESQGTPIFEGAANWANGQVSADGKWLAYMSDESGAWEVYVTNFPGLGGKWQVSQGGGTEPRWRHDGKELFYVNSKGVLTAVPVSTVNGFAVGVPVPLFLLRARMALSSTDCFSYDVTRDGQKFLVNRYISPEHVRPLDIAIGITASEGQK